MKKSVVILIALIFIASVVAVSFFGLQFKTFDEIVYVESIEILNEDVELDDTGMPFVVVFPDANGVRQYQIKWRVHPDNATDDGVSFAYDSQGGAVTIDENGVVTFQTRGGVTVQIIAKDGSAKTTMTIYCF
ncbi:MAG: hypothetical protein J6U87_00030 [Clostridia bacterium]|nr:hypothetical protein [Clostridia bacterium]